MFVYVIDLALFGYKKIYLVGGIKMLPEKCDCCDYEKFYINNL